MTPLGPAPSIVHMNTTTAALAITAIPTSPRYLKDTVTAITADGVEFTATYCGVAVKQGELLLTLKDVPVEAGGSKGKGWLDTPLTAIASHTFTMVPRETGPGFVHIWTPAN